MTLGVFTEASALVTGSVGYIMMTYRIGAIVMRKMTFLARGTFPGDEPHAFGCYSGVGSCTLIKVGQLNAVAVYEPRSRQEIFIISKVPRPAAGPN
jgi:hypothetical protein